MRSLNIIMMFLLATSFSFAQDLNPTEVPQAVKTAFTKENVKATDVEWERDMDNYKVEFDVGRMEHEIWYTPSGAVIKREQDLSSADLPQSIRDVISKKYPDYRIDDVEMTWQDDKTTYKVEVEKGKEDWKLIFDPNGKLISEMRD